MSYKLFISVLISLLFSGCIKENAIDKTLYLSGNNKKEIEQVLHRYRHPEDSLKLKAARFLIANMGNKTYLNGDRIAEFHEFIDTIYKIEAPVYHEQTYYRFFLDNSVYQRQRPDTCSDARTLTAQYLIHHIEEAFRVWNKPWNAHVNFEEFCELILPYRLGNELPEMWRPLYRDKFEKAVGDSVRTAFDACTRVNDLLIRYPIHIVHTSVRTADMKPSSLIHIKFGLCEDYAQLATFAMRACGIPVAMETIPAFGKKRSKHTFNVVYNNDRRYYNFSGAEQNPADLHLQRFDAIPKVYRYTYGIQKEALASVCGDEPVPPFFRNPCLKDVTANYDFIQPRTVAIRPDKKTLPHKKFFYLCVFGVNGWRPVAWTKLTAGSLRFEQVGSGIIYQLACYTGEKMQTVGYPFELSRSGAIRYFIPSDSRKTDLHLDRKYPPADHLKNIPSTLVGSKFQGADRSDFRDAADLYTFDTVPSSKYTTVPIDSNRAYRYYRFLSSSASYINMAEIEFYERDTDALLTGEAIGTSEPNPYYPNQKPGDVFDGDALTFYNAVNTGGYVGLKLDTPRRVGRIRYIIRNDDNGIRKSRLYELFYADNGRWVSAGKKTAVADDAIVFENVPADAVYWLHNHTKGHEERIFLYKNGAQEWW